MDSKILFKICKKQKKTNKSRPSYYECTRGFERIQNLCYVKHDQFLLQIVLLQLKAFFVESIRFRCDIAKSS